MHEQNSHKGTNKIGPEEQSETGAVLGEKAQFQQKQLFYFHLASLFSLPPL